jgi:hypothetical protein
MHAFEGIAGLLFLVLFLTAGFLWMRSYRKSWWAWHAAEWQRLFPDGFSGTPR